MYKNNIIDLTGRLKAKPSVSRKGKKSAKTVLPETGVVNPVLDMTERRQEIINDERRKVRRTILTGFIGAYVILPKQGLMKVEIYDISDDGLSFDLDDTHGQFTKGEEIAMRVYLSQDIYFPFIIRVQNGRKIEGDRCYRHGAFFVKGTLNDQALHHFVKFIETVSASLERDGGDVMVSNLKK